MVFAHNFTFDRVCWFDLVPLFGLFWYAYVCIFLIVCLKFAKILLNETLLVYLLAGFSYLERKFFSGFNRFYLKRCSYVVIKQIFLNNTIWQFFSFHSFNLDSISFNEILFLFFFYIENECDDEPLKKKSKSIMSTKKSFKRI